jgi:hypothetical protein
LDKKRRPKFVTFNIYVIFYTEGFPNYGLKAGQEIMGGGKMRRFVKVLDEVALYLTMLATVYLWVSFLIISLSSFANLR